MSWDAMFTKVGAGSMPASPDLPPMISAQALQRTAFPPVSWLLRDMIPEGLTLLAGKPKLGKSWLALQLGYGVATGCEVLGRPVDQGRVLYAALEDNPRRLKSRLQKSTPPFAEWPETLSFVTEWPRLDAGGLDTFEAWVSHTPDAKLLIVDTLATVRPNGNAKESQYQGDYAALRGLHRLANDTGLSIIAVHHVRKADADDPFDTVSGSTGLTGAADTTLILTKTTDGVVLYGRGRDLPEFESALGFDPGSCLWSDLGRPSDVFGSETRQAIRMALKAGKQTPSEISEHGDLDYELCAKTLQRMVEGGEIEKGGRGRYRLTPDPLSS
ncbi:AAA family ATPase [Silicimonas sp. MF1-12-2]|uniref:AAA family ATPase n=1 Tax=Silicimonas sp. MF1-12-2 TaxID=3384793 RepID=UPI0039B5C188